MPMIKYCDQCGAAVGPEAKYCSQCGSKIQQQVAENLVCKSCGHSMIVNADDRTIAECPACGATQIIIANQGLRMHELTSKYKEKEARRGFQKWLVEFFFGRTWLVVGLSMVVAALLFEPMEPIISYGMLFTIIGLCKKPKQR